MYIILDKTHVIKFQSRESVSTQLDFMTLKIWHKKTVLNLPQTFCPFQIVKYWTFCIQIGNYRKIGRGYLNKSRQIIGLILKFIKNYNFVTKNLLTNLGFNRPFVALNTNLKRQCYTQCLLSNEIKILSRKRVKT